MPKNQDPKTTIKLSLDEARRFLLAHHHLWPPKQIRGKEGILDLFQRLGCVQFDTINVVGRNADLVLQARVADYRPEMLAELLYEDRKLIDGWDKVASIYQTLDWPYFARHRKLMGEYHYRRSEDVIGIIPEVLSAIEEHGPISSLHFKDAPKTDWFWSATTLPRAAMETLFAEGRIGVAHRVNTRRFFDLIERLVPAGVLVEPDPNYEEEDYQDWHILRRIGSMGLAAPGSGEHWQGITALRKVVDRRPVLDRLLESGRIHQVEVEGLGNQVLYIRAEDLVLLDELREGDLPEPTMAFIAPLDNIIWNRKLIGKLFDFDYVWEVYKPKTQREFGYYVLPVVYGDGFIARVDMKLERKTNTIIVLNWWWQPDVKADDQIRQAAADCFRDFKEYLGADGYNVDAEAKNRTFLRKVAR